MNRWKPVATILFCGTLLAAQPGHAQDDGGFGGGFGGFDGGGFGGGGFGGGNRSGQQQQQQQTRVATTLLQADAPETLMAELKRVLDRNSAPKLSKDQEKEMAAFLAKEAKSALAGIAAKAKEQNLNLPNAQAAAAPPLGKNAQDVVLLFFELNSGRGGNNNNQNRNNNNQGNRGNRGGNNNGNNNNRLNALVLRPAEDAFLMTLANAPALNAKQKTAVLKWRSDVIRQRGGVDEFSVQMEEAGGPLTPEQVTQLRTIFEDSEQKRTTLRNDLLQKVQDLQNPDAPRESANQQNQNQNNNPLNQLQGLGRVDDAKVLALNTDFRQKFKAFEEETDIKILRALTPPQQQIYVKIEQLRRKQRQENTIQQAQQVLTRR
jgi:hypothetical protein